MAKQQDRIEATLKVMPESWFLGPLEGRKRADFLREEIERRSDRAALERALSLGGHPLPTEDHKRKRHAQRAVLLVDFVLRKKPLSLKDALQKQAQSLPLATLIRAVKSGFPAYPERAGKRTSWSPANFTDPATLGELQTRQDWSGKSLPRFKFVIHAMPENKAKLSGGERVFATHWERVGHGRFQPQVDALENAPQILTEPAKKLRSRLAISASVVSEKSCAPYANIGLILKVPALNILTTSPEDQWFDNRAGTEASRDGATNPTDMAALIMHTGWSIGDLMSPDEVLALTGTPGAMQRLAPGGKGGGRHNEVVICGRPGLPMGAGLTGTLDVVGMFLSVDMEGNTYDGAPPHQRVRPATEDNVRDAARRLKIPLLYLPFVSR